MRNSKKRPFQATVPNDQKKLRTDFATQKNMVQRIQITITPEITATITSFIEAVSTSEITFFILSLITVLV